jgi:penicillin-binding protein 1A
MEAPAQMQSVRRARPAPIDQSLIADDFHKRLRGKPTHAAHSHSWFSGFSAGLGLIIKVSVIILLLVVFMLGGFGGGMLIGYISTTKPLTISDLMTSDKKQTTFVYDKSGNEIQKLTGSDNVDRVFVSYSEVKNTYIDEAITSIEDERFYEHNGIDIQRIGSAVLSALANGGTATYGGSTITQQTVKMISGQNQVSTQRKVQEWFSAMALEQELTKDEIMELYINQAPMGNNYVGIQSAAQNYFGKDAKDLTLPECAFLAGIPKSPSYYNPLRESGKRNALRRMRVVLSKMHELGKITDAQYEDALNTELVFKTNTTTTTNSVQSYFVEYAVNEVITDLMAQRNISRTLAANLVYNNGYKIYTTEEPTVQADLDKTFSTQSLFQSNPAEIENLPEKPQGGMVVINVTDGAIAAMQGGYGEKTLNLVTNRAVGAFRQPGSSIKPLIDYGPALERKLIVPATPFEDKAMNLDPSNPNTVWPKNSSGGYYGTLSVRQAVYKSSNIIAVQVWDMVGADTALWFLKQVGIDRTTEKYPSTAIGGFNNGMSPLEMASAYATFANNGVYREPYAYTKVVDSDGNVVMKKSVIATKVYSPETSFMMTSMLEDVITTGTAAGNVMPITTDSGESIEVAGKTGTTDDNVDKWFCGYTPYYAAATWYGYDNRLRKTEIPVDDRSNAQHIWNDAMQAIHKTLTPSASGTVPTFTKPDDVEKLTICTQTRLIATDTCIAAGTVTTDYFVKGSPMTPTALCPGHATPTPVPTVDPGIIPTQAPLVTPAA